MGWNYRLLIHDDGGEDYYAVHEVFYTDGKPDMWTVDPIDFGGESVASAQGALATALHDIHRMPPLRIVGDVLVDESESPDAPPDPRRPEKRDGSVPKKAADA